MKFFEVLFFLFINNVLLIQVEELKDLSLGLFCTSTGTAAALRASVIRKTEVLSIVYRGGRPDLAKDILLSVKAATHLIEN